MQEFADRIIAELEKGVKAWVKPWNPELCRLPRVRLGKGISHAVAVNGEKGLLVTVTDNGGLLQIHTAVRNLLRPADEAVVEKVKVYRLAAVGTRVGGPECIRPQRSSHGGSRGERFAGWMSQRIPSWRRTHPRIGAGIDPSACLHFEWLSGRRTSGEPARQLPALCKEGWLKCLQ
jgi:hypothetical protein